MTDTPAAPPGDAHGADKAASPPIVVKKYANRRLYNTETSSYITLDNLAGMIRAGRDFVVYDAKSGEDITRGVLTQIIVEEESKGSAMLPTAFLRQLIAFYGGNLQGVVPKYLEVAMSTFSQQQQQMRAVMERTFGPFMPTGVEEMNRQNLALVERAFSMWNPFLAAGADKDAHGQPTQAASGQASPAAPDMEQLRSEIARLQSQLAASQASAAVAGLAAPPATPVAADTQDRTEPHAALEPAKSATAAK